MSSSLALKNTKRVAKSSVSVQTRRNRRIRTCTFNQDKQESQNPKNLNDSQRFTKKTNDSQENDDSLALGNNLNSTVELSEQCNTSEENQKLHRLDFFDSSGIDQKSSADEASERKSDELPSITVSLPEYVGAVFEYDNAHPAKSTRWHSPLFSFVRLLKRYPELRELDGNSVADKIETIMRNWPDYHPQSDVWESVFWDRGDEDFRLEFINCWQRARIPAGYDCVQEAFRLANEEPLVPPVNHGTTYALFISVAAHLQAMQGELPIMLPVKRLAKELGVSPNMISIYRALAKKDGLLAEVQSCVCPGRGRGRATEFRFASEKFSELKGDKRS